MQKHEVFQVVMQVNNSIHINLWCEECINLAQDLNISKSNVVVKPQLSSPHPFNNSSSPFWTLRFSPGPACVREIYLTSPDLPDFQEDASSRKTLANVRFPQQTQLLFGYTCTNKLKIFRAVLCPWGKILWNCSHRNQ